MNCLMSLSWELLWLHWDRQRALIFSLFLHAVPTLVFCAASLTLVSQPFVSWPHNQLLPEPSTQGYFLFTSFYGQCLTHQSFLFAHRSHNTVASAWPHLPQTFCLYPVCTSCQSRSPTKTLARKWYLSTPYPFGRASWSHTSLGHPIQRFAFLRPPFSLNHWYAPIP